MAVGTMTLHRFNGDEIYRVDSATISYLKDEDGLFAVWFDAKTGKVPIQTLPDTESLRIRPAVELTLHLPKPLALVLFTGRSFSIPKGYAKRTHDYHANFSYGEHEPMDDNGIVIVEREGLQVNARISGTIKDVNDSSKPHTKVVIEADFTMKIKL